MIKVSCGVTMAVNDGLIGNFKTMPSPQQPQFTHTGFNYYARAVYTHAILYLYRSAFIPVL